MSTTAVAAGSRTRAALPPVVRVLALGTFLMGSSEFVVAGLLPEIAADHAVTVAQAGLVITTFAIGMIVGSPTMVLLTLRLPRRGTLALALAVFAAGHVVAAISGVFWLLLAARFVTAVATGAFWAVASLVAADAAGPGAKMRALGVVQGGGMLATVVGVPLGAVAGQVLGWRGPFWALAVLAVVAAGSVLRLVPHDAPRDAPVTLRGELAALRSGRLWLTLLTCALVTGGVLSVYSYISPLLTDRTGLPAAMVPVALIVFGVAALAGTVAGGRLGDRRPSTTLLAAGAVTLLAIVLLGALSSAPAPTLLLFGVLGLSGLSANPVLGFLAIKYGGPAPTLASALTPSAFNLGTAVGTGVTSAALAGPPGDLAPVLVGGSSAVLMLGAAGALALLAARDRRVPSAAIRA